MSEFPGGSAPISIPVKMDEGADGMEMDDPLSSSLPGGSGEGSRSSRLARKAESARQARLRHKQFVGELQDQVAGLQTRLAHMESVPTAARAVQELKGALSEEQLTQLNTWLAAAQGEEHVLVRYKDAPPPPPPLPPEPNCKGISGIGGASSAPIAINGNGKSPRSAPMEDEDEGQFTMSRSWDDIEGARSILNLNSPNGFHPAVNAGPAPSSFLLPAAAAAASAGSCCSQSAPSAGSYFLHSGGSAPPPQHFPSFAPPGPST